VLEHQGDPDHATFCKGEGHMAAANTTLTYTYREVHHLADKLYSRGSSKLAVEPPEQARDLRVAARLLWRFGQEMGAGRVLYVAGE
jgi:hypothetical protein